MLLRMKFKELENSREMNDWPFQDYGLPLTIVFTDESLPGEPYQIRIPAGTLTMDKAPYRGSMKDREEILRDAGVPDREIEFARQSAFDMMVECARNRVPFKDFPEDGQKKGYKPRRIGDLPLTPMWVTMDRFMLVKHVPEPVIP